MPIAPASAFPFCSGSYQAESPIIDSQRSINLYPESEASSSVAQTALIGTPGLTLFCTLPHAPVRALWAGSFEATAGRLFAVGGTHVYELDPSGTVLKDFGAMPGSSGVGPCVFKENGYQLVVLDGPPSGAGIFNVTENGAPAGPPTFGPNPGGLACDPVFNGVALEYLDGFYVAVATPTFPPQNQINVSLPLDGMTVPWPGLAVAQRTGSADLVTQIAVVQNLLWIFGLKTIEVWYNVGTQPFPFARAGSSTIQQGLLAQFTVAKIDDSLFWLGADDRGY